MVSLFKEYSLKFGNDICYPFSRTWVNKTGFQGMFSILLLCCFWQFCPRMCYVVFHEWNLKRLFCLNDGSSVFYPTTYNISIVWCEWLLYVITTGIFFFILFMLLLSTTDIFFFIFFFATLEDFKIYRNKKISFWNFLK